MSDGTPLPGPGQTTATPLPSPPVSPHVAACDDVPGQSYPEDSDSLNPLPHAVAHLRSLAAASHSPSGGGGGGARNHRRSLSADDRPTTYPQHEAVHHHNHTEDRQVPHEPTSPTVVHSPTASSMAGLGPSISEVVTRSTPEDLHIPLAASSSSSLAVAAGMVHAASSPAPETPPLSSSTDITTSTSRISPSLDVGATASTASSLTTFPVAASGSAANGAEPRRPGKSTLALAGLSRWDSGETEIIVVSTKPVAATKDHYAPSFAAARSSTARKPASSSSGNSGDASAAAGSAGRRRLSLFEGLVAPSGSAEHHSSSSGHAHADRNGHYSHADRGGSDPHEHAPHSSIVELRSSTVPIPVGPRSHLDSHHATAAAAAARGGDAGADDDGLLSSSYPPKYAPLYVGPATSGRRQSLRIAPDGSRVSTTAAATTSSAAAAAAAAGYEGNSSNVSASRASLVYKFTIPSKGAGAQQKMNAVLPRPVIPRPTAKSGIQLAGDADQDNDNDDDDDDIFKIRTRKSDGSLDQETQPSDSVNGVSPLHASTAAGGPQSNSRRATALDQATLAKQAALAKRDMIARRLAFGSSLADRSSTSMGSGEQLAPGAVLRDMLASNARASAAIPNGGNGGSPHLSTPPKSGPPAVAAATISTVRWQTEPVHMFGLGLPVSAGPAPIDDFLSSILTPSAALENSYMRGARSPRLAPVPNRLLLSDAQSCVPPSPFMLESPAIRLEPSSRTSLEKAASFASSASASSASQQSPVADHPGIVTAPPSIAPARGGGRHVNDESRDSDDDLLSEEEDRRKQASRYDVQRCEVKAGSVLRRGASVRSSVSGSDHTVHHDGEQNGHHSPPNRSQSHVSILGRFFHSDPHSPHSPHSPVHEGSGSPELYGSAAGAEPKRRSSGTGSTIRKSNSIREKLDRTLHPEHYLGSGSLAQEKGHDSPRGSGQPVSSAEHSPKLSPSQPNSGAESDGQERSPSMRPIMNFLSRKRSETVTPSSKSGGHLTRSNSESSLHEKYGVTKEVLGKGANATVRLAHKLHYGHGHHGAHDGHHGRPGMPGGGGDQQGSTHHSQHTTATRDSQGGPSSAMGSMSSVDGRRDSAPSTNGSQGRLTRQGSMHASNATDFADGPQERLFAIKKFRKRRRDESERDYVKKLSAEFCISSALHHPNVIETVDLIQDEQSEWCEVMEYMAGGDLFARIANGPPMNVGERDCLFAQLISGLTYLHSVGVSHRDLKPENLLLDADGRTLKIADFGTSEVFRVPWQSERRRVKGVAGSDPYIAPEEWKGGEYDPDRVDVWATGIIYFVMLHKTIAWKAAVPADPHYSHFLEARKTGMFEYIDELEAEPEGPRDLLYKILEPDPMKRITAEDINKDRWFMSIDGCAGHHHSAKHGHSTGFAASQLQK